MSAPFGSRPAKPGHSIYYKIRVDLNHIPYNEWRREIWQIAEYRNSIVELVLADPPEGIYGYFGPAFDVGSNSIFDGFADIEAAGDIRIEYCGTPGQMRAWGDALRITRGEW